MNEESKTTREEVISWAIAGSALYGAMWAWAADAHTLMLVLALIGSAAILYTALKDRRE